MTGTPDAVRPPADDAEWARATEKRLASLENPGAVRVGAWVLSESDAGHLIASHNGGGAFVLARKPANGEVDPDAISDALPAVTLVRTSLQTVPNAGTTIVWDGVRFERGNWTSGKATLDSVVVPEDGFYFVNCTLNWSVGGYMVSCIMIDGQTRIAGKSYDNGSEWPTSVAIGRVPMYAGQSVSVFAHVGGTRSVGAATFYGQPIPCELSVTMTDRMN